jgi:NAD(P)-dependent dehydrogenase (short-subunit alcohol dehydrogenase family)
VTGASRGIGRAIAEALSAEGAQVAVNYRTGQSKANEVVQAISRHGRKAIAVRADTTLRAEVEPMVESIVKDFGGIDILVNNAGVLKRTPFLQIPEDEWDWVLDANLKGYFLVGQAVAREMVKQGTGGVIINISSDAAKVPGFNLAHYSSSKAGVWMLTQVMAVELAPLKIRVNALGPGLIETDMNRRDLANPEYRELRLARIPLRVIGRPEDVVGGVVFLASDESRLVTGTTIYMDAGESIS